MILTLESSRRPQPARFGFGWTGSNGRDRRAADGLRGSSNLLAEGFALVLINQALFAGSHFGAVVNIVIWYLVALFATSTITVFGGGRRAARAGVVSPLHAAARSQPSLPPRARG